MPGHIDSDGYSYECDDCQTNTCKPNAKPKYMNNVMKQLYEELLFGADFNMKAGNGTFCVFCRGLIFAFVENRWQLFDFGGYKY